MAYLNSEQLERDLSIRDLTNPNQGPHSIQLILNAAVSALSQRWDIPIHEYRGPRVVDVADNYDRLGFDPGAVSRELRYSRYVDEHTMLRSHTSAMIPAALRQLDAAAPDTLVVCPGITYRRDSIDKLHTGTPHQVDLWRISRAELSDVDLDEMIDTLVTTVLPGLEYRCEERSHPYTENGRQIDVLYNGGWVELGECGLASRAVLGDAGLVNHTGLAMGPGLDRMLMMRKGLTDIRLLRAADPRISRQMLDLEPYREVSNMPAIKRDISIAVHTSDDAELLGDVVRSEMGNDAELVEDVTLLSETAYDQLPVVARQRLGMGPEHKNVLVRLTLRCLERTLTDEEANRLRDRIYRLLHQGTEPAA